MSLVQFKPNFRQVQNNFSATPSVNTQSGTTVTASGSINTKGSYAQLISSTNYDVEYMFLLISGGNNNGSVKAGLMDIAIGGAGSEQIVVADLLIGGTSAPAQFCLQELMLPLRIPAGTRIAARVQSLIASQSYAVQISLFGGSNSPPFPVYSGCEVLGIDTSDSGGTAHTGGNTGTESAWASIGSTLSRDWKAIQLLCSAPSGAALNNTTYHFELGYSSTTLMEWIIGVSANELCKIFPCGPIPCFIPSGTQLQIRGECSNTGQSLDFAVLGMY